MHERTILWRVPLAFGTRFWVSLTIDRYFFSICGCFGMFQKASNECNRGSLCMSVGAGDGATRVPPGRNASYPPDSSMATQQTLQFQKYRDRRSR